MSAVDSHQREHDEQMLHDYMERFVRRWAPEDKHEAANFHADFIRVVQVIHQDAARPFSKMLESALAAMPSAFISKPK